MSRPPVSHQSAPQNRRRRRRRRQTSRALVVLCLLLFLGAGVYGFIRSIVRPPELPKTTVPDPIVEQDPASPKDGGNQTNPEDGKDPKPSKPVFTRKDLYFTILVSGLDDDNGGSDTNILLSIDGKNKRINAVSLPRDTLIDVDWNVKKLNSAYNVGGTARLKQEASRMLGIPIDFYITVNLEGFVELVDAIGGVTFDVPIDMNYDDPVQDLHIHFTKGSQHLSGEEALKVVRFRHNNDGTGYGTEDIGRIGTQQKFLMTVAKQMLSHLDLKSIQAYAAVFMDYVKTDLTVGNLVWMGEIALGAGMDNIRFYTLPGDGSGYYKKVSYYILYPDQVLTLINDSFNPYHEPLTMENLHILSPKS